MMMVISDSSTRAPQIDEFLGSLELQSPPPAIRRAAPTRNKR
jgi:hypothetical protein